MSVKGAEPPGSQSSPPLIIRRAESADMPALAALVIGFRDHLGAVAPTEDELLRQLPAALLDPALEFACAWLDGNAVGYTQTRFFTSIWACGTEAHLEDLFVVAAARRRNVGRALLRHALARATERGARQFALTTNEGNRAAQSLYRNEGLSPQSHALYPGGQEVLWTRRIGEPGN